MVSFTKQLTQRQFEFIKSKLNKYKIATKSEYIVFAAEYLETKINIYNSLKIVVQGKNVEKVLEFLTIKVNKPEVIDETSCSYIGCDETGNGNYFGGVYCVAAYVHKDSVARLKELGISDSKNYTDEQIIKIMNNLRKVAKKEHIIMSYNCQWAGASLYNKLYKKYKNANVIKTIIHNYAIYSLKLEMLDERVNPRIGELPPQEIKFGKNVKIVMDEYVNRQKYYSYLDEYEREISHPNIDIFTPNAESKYTAVALASMIARMYFLYDIKGMSKAAGFKIPLGSASTKIMNAAKKIDPKDRHKYIKLHFKNTNVLN